MSKRDITVRPFTVFPKTYNKKDQTFLAFNTMKNGKRLHLENAQSSGNTLPGKAGTDTFREALKLVNRLMRTVAGSIEKEIYDGIKNYFRSTDRG
ncbi:MAG: hypothetical protein JRJ86_03295 [Deltaproteobacteria bacterium]|nr:hypothetical protein [Deltaproteobacteria bacterium]